jgi:hypothetical protein
MAVPTLSPSSTTSAITLPVTSSDSSATVAATLPFGVYTTEEFVTGALKQVAFTYKKLGGDVLDVELTKGNVYTCYEEACLEYSYIVNFHQTKNVLSNVLGNTTGTFDHKGEISSGPTGVALKYPKIRFEYAKRYSKAAESEVGFAGHETIYSASFDTAASVQDYDLQAIVSSAATSDATLLYSDTNLGDNAINNRRILIKKIYYKTPHAMWRFFGYYGGLNVIGNLYSYGQYGDDSSFEVIPTWQNKLQAAAFEDSIYTRLSHYSYEIKNNRLRLFPNVSRIHPSKMWIEFIVQSDAWDEDSDRTTGVDGINNMNTVPFANLPYANINSIGKQWIRRFALALSKEMLGQIRGKFQTVPIPGESVTLNASDLLSQAKEEQEKLREELKTMLEEMTYQKLAEADAAISENVSTLFKNIPAPIFTG